MSPRGFTCPKCPQWEKNPFDELRNLEQENPWTFPYGNIEPLFKERRLYAVVDVYGGTGAARFVNSIDELQRVHAILYG